MTTAMEIDASSAALKDSNTTPFTVESLSESLQPIAKQALTTNTENAATNYDALETQLRSHLLSIVAENDLVLLQQEWTACWNLCIYLLEHCPDLDRFIRKLPFVLLEDIVECLPLTQHVEQFWESIRLDALCSGILWQSTNNQSHILQYIRLQNTLLQRLSPSSRHAGTILMQLAKTLPLSDRSALKLWGSVSGRTTEYNQDEHDDDEEESSVANLHNVPLTHQEQQEAQSFHQVFWSVQHDMANPYSISFANFFKNIKTILAALESNSLTTTTTSNLPSTSKYLTKRRLLPLQLQDATFLKHWLTQFLIIESFVSSQSTQLKTTLGDLQNRAKALLRKLPGGNEHLETLQHILQNSEALWRQWKKARCKPDMERLAVDTSTTEECTDTTSTEHLPMLLQNNTQRLTLQDLQETAKTTMAVPSLESHLENYVDALDPEAGIEAEYHPKNDKLYVWRSLRLLKRQYLNYFSSIRRSDGDLERMVREIYKHERNVDIPGEMPTQDVELDYDEKLGQEENKEKEAEEEGATKVVEEEATTPPDDVDEKEVVEKSNVEESQELKVEMKEDEPKLSSFAEMAGEENVPDAPKDEEDEDTDAGEVSKQDESLEEEKEALEAESPATKPMDEENPSDDSEAAEKEEVGPTKTEALTPFEQAAMEEEAILLAEHEEEDAKQAASAAAEEKEADKEEPSSKDTSKEESNQEAPKKETIDDRKRKRGISDGSTADENAAKRSRGNQGRSTSGQSQQRGRQDNRMGMGRHGRGAGRAAGGGGRGRGRGQNMPPPRRSPPPPPHQGGPSQQHQRPPPPGRGGRGGDGGRGRVPGRGGGGRGDDGRRQPQRRDSRRRY